jgi:hypothetical protein
MARRQIFHASDSFLSLLDFTLFRHYWKLAEILWTSNCITSFNDLGDELLCSVNGTSGVIDINTNFLIVFCLSLIL